MAPTFTVYKCPLVTRSPGRRGAGRHRVGPVRFTTDRRSVLAAARMARTRPKQRAVTRRSGGTGRLWRCAIYATPGCVE